MHQRPCGERSIRPVQFNSPNGKGMKFMYRSSIISLACAIALLSGCASNQTNKHASNKTKPQPVASTTQPSNSVAAAPTTAPTANADNPLTGNWQLAVPRHRQRDATITATD